MAPDKPAARRWPEAASSYAAWHRPRRRACSRRDLIFAVPDWPGSVRSPGWSHVPRRRCRRCRPGPPRAVPVRSCALSCAVTCNWPPRRAPGLAARARLARLSAFCPPAQFCRRGPSRSRLLAPAGPKHPIPAAPRLPRWLPDTPGPRQRDSSRSISRTAFPPSRGTARSRSWWPCWSRPR